jgi:ATP-dependent exoDNAse (exonuclease V) beta subunit
MQNFLVYKSSAGSGKTYTLVKEYLRIILVDPSRIRKILAITFTNAAASEMKERIIASLGELSALSGKQAHERPMKSVRLLETLKSETNLLSSEIIQNARQALTLILHNYSDFSVSTIDSFAHRVIRSFAFDLKLPLNFDVELDQDQLLSQAIDLMISRTGNDPALTKLLIDYIESRTDDEKSHYIEGDIARLAGNLMDEKGSVFVSRLKDLTLEDFGKIHQKLTASIRNFESSVKEKATAAYLLIKQQGLHEAQFFQKDKGIAGWFKALSEGRIADKISPNSYVIKTISENKWASGAASSDDCQAIDTIKDQLTSYYHHIEQITRDFLPGYRLHCLIRNNLYPVALLSELEKVMEEIKSEKSMLHISDFNKKISEVVASEPTPFIYERIGERYHHFMIDEFQDTSGLQWQNFLPLIDNALAGANLNLIVGDGKQAIYRWRNGDVEQFADLPLVSQQITAEGREQWQQNLLRNHKALNLDTNYRSLPSIVEFNNQIFEFASSYLPQELSRIYLDHTQKVPPGKEGGYVQIDFLNDFTDQEIAYQEQTHQKVLETIHNLKELNHPLNNITILCRANHQASQIARFLLENNINVISSESLLLHQSNKVCFMLSVLRLVDHSEDEVSIAEYLSYLVSSGLISGSLHDVLIPVITNRNTDKGKALEELTRQHGIEFSFSSNKHSGLYELGENIVRSFFNERNPDPFIAFFMDVLHEYSNKYTGTLSGFLEWWAENSSKYSVVVPEGIDAVRVMTIHKSKGLQFPVVICPFCDQDFSKPGKKGQWVELPFMEETSPLSVAWLSYSKLMNETPYEDDYKKELGKTVLDVLNVLYVALTRPVEKLFIISRTENSNGNNLSGILRDFLKKENLWSEQLSIYSFGINPACIAKTPVINESSEEMFGEYISLPWSDRISVRTHQPENTAGDTASGRGLIIHEIMEKINDADDLPRVLQQFTDAGIIDSDEKTILHEKILSIINLPELKEFFSPGVFGKNECGMYDQNGDYFRADRVILNYPSAAIIEYKTGQPHDNHRLQIERYVTLLKEMGYTQIRDYLVYLDLQKVL